MRDRAWRLMASNASLRIRKYKAGAGRKGEIKNGIIQAGT